MANTTAVLRGYVSSALKDTSNATWSTTDIDLLVTRAVASLYPRVQFALDPNDYLDLLVADTYFYDIPAVFMSLHRLELLDGDGEELGQLATGTWEVHGSFMRGTARVRITPSLVTAGNYIRYVGYGRYDLSTYLIPDDYIAYVVAHARAAAFGWLTSDRVRFRQWANSDQTVNTSVNELGQMVNDAQRDVEVERSRIFTMRKPMPGRF